LAGHAFALTRFSHHSLPTICQKKDHGNDFHNDNPTKDGDTWPNYAVEDVLAGSGRVSWQLRGGMVMTFRAHARSARSSETSKVKRNFILQQGLCEPVAASCPVQYSGLQFQPRLVGLWLLLATILQAQLLFFALAVVLWWSAVAPRLNPFDAVYNWILAGSRGITLAPAPTPRRFAQFLAGSFASGIGISLVMGWRTTALVLEGFFIAAVAALVFGGFCFGSFVFHVLRGRADFAKRTLPWAAE